MDVAVDTLLFAGHTNLADDLFRAPTMRGLGRVHSGRKVAAFRVLLRPPFQQHRKTLLRRVNRPIQLRCEVIDPAINQPLPRVSEQLVVSVIALNGRRIVWTPNAEGADSEFYPWLDCLDLLINSMNESVDVLAAPIFAAQFPSGSIALPTGGVGKFHILAGTVLLRVGVKIIVE